MRLPVTFAAALLIRQLSSTFPYTCNLAVTFINFRQSPVTPVTCNLAGRAGCVVASCCIVCASGYICVPAKRKSVNGALRGCCMMFGTNDNQTLIMFGTNDNMPAAGPLWLCAALCIVRGVFVPIKKKGPLAWLYVRAAGITYCRHLIAIGGPLVYRGSHRAARFSRFSRCSRL